MGQKLLTKFLNDYSMLFVLVVLCGYYSFATLEKRASTGKAGGVESAKQILSQTKSAKSVSIVVGPSPDNAGFADEAVAQLKAGGVTDTPIITGEPRDVRLALRQLADSHHVPDAILCTSDELASLDPILANLTAFSNVPRTSPLTHTWPTFLTSGNLIHIAENIVVIAIMGVGMTMVIITGGIDLSVGSLVALAAVIAGLLVRDHASDEKATAIRMIACGCIAIAACGVVGAFTGLIVTVFKVPPFIITLSMMLVASGRAYKLCSGHAISNLPDAFTRLGLAKGFGGIPYDVFLMLGVCAVAHVVMSRTRLGRYIYAIGGNAEAARLSGVNVRSIILTVYIVSGLCAGLGGVIVASQLKSGDPTYGLGYELSVIAAVVVGGTSLMGGEGSIGKTLVGALIIAVILNGMNLTGVGSYSQKEVLGWVILGAVLLDSVRRYTGWKMPGKMRRVPGIGTEHEPTVIQNNEPQTIAAIN